MSRPDRAKRRTTLVWSLSAATLTAALLVALSVSRRDAPASPEPVVEAATAATSPQIQPPSPTLAGRDDRERSFRARVLLARPLEAAILRAFLGPAPAVVRGGGAVKLARVSPGRSPQACLAQAVYYEARGEPAEGQAAVAQVVLNRTRSGLHPSDVCGAVFENASRRGCQFSFACDPRLARRGLEPAAWRRAQTVAADVLAGRGPPELRTALNYHADYVRPRWAAQLQRTAEIGRHIFYASAAATGRALAGWTFQPPAPPAGA